MGERRERKEGEYRCIGEGSVVWQREIGKVEGQMMAIVERAENNCAKIVQLQVRMVSVKDGEGRVAQREGIEVG